MDPPLILASRSPRRQELLINAGYEFTVIVADESVEQAVPDDLPPAEYVCAAAFAKAQHVADNVDRGIVLAADTVAECDGQILGKPRNREHAEQILRTISGRKHRVLTGVVLWHRPSDRIVSHLESTELEMQVLDELLLADYLDSGKWAGKAGGFGYQDGLDWVRIIAGLESNVVGLPMEVLPGLIKACGGQII